MATDIHSFAFRRMRSAQAGMVNVITSDDERVAIAAVHVQCIVAGFKDLALFEGHVLSANEPHTRTAALKPQSSDHNVRTIHEFDVVLFVTLVFRPREQRRLARRGANDYGL